MIIEKKDRLYGIAEELLDIVSYIYYLSFSVN